MAPLSREIVTAPSPRRFVREWVEANPASRQLAERATAVLPAGVTHDVRRDSPFPLAVARALGSRKWDLDGHEVICYVMGHGSLLLGHGDEAVVEAVREQAGRSLHPGACHELEVRWAEAVVDLVPSAELVRFTASGTEASLLALRLARAATGRPRVAKLVGHFHGWNDQVSYGADEPFDGPDSAGLPPLTDGALSVLPVELDALSAALERRDVAALILEPSGAAWGTVPLPPGFLADCRRIADETGTVLIFDEVVTGFRWSPGGVQGLVGVTPDLTVLGKVLAGGMPGGAVAGRAAILSLLALPADDSRRVAHPGTHNAHPVSAAAGLATLSAVRTGEPQERAGTLARQLREGLNETFSRCGVAGRAYGEASTFHLLFGDAEPLEGIGTARLKAGGMTPELSKELHRGMLLRGVQLFHGSGFLSSAHSETDVEETLSAFAAVLPELPLDDAR